MNTKIQNNNRVRFAQVFTIIAKYQCIANILLYNHVWEPEGDEIPTKLGWYWDRDRDWDWDRDWDGGRDKPGKIEESRGFR